MTPAESLIAIEPQMRHVPLGEPIANHEPSVWKIAGTRKIKNTAWLAAMRAHRADPKNCPKPGPNVTIREHDLVDQYGEKKTIKTAHGRDLGYAKVTIRSRHNAKILGLIK